MRHTRHVTKKVGTLIKCQNYCVVSRLVVSNEINTKKRGRRQKKNEKLFRVVVVVVVVLSGRR